MDVKIPCTMATQHPDSATRVVSVSEEVEEAVQCLKHQDQGLACDEYLVDYMGKLTPYHQIGQIIKALNKETDLVPGVDSFITPRMVSSFQDEPFRQLMTLTAVMEGIYNSSQTYGEPGITEMVHAMTTVRELRDTRDRAKSILSMLAKDLKLSASNDIQIIPLFEGVPELLSMNQMIPELTKELGSQRLFLGKSETALVYGHPASSLACKLALADIHILEIALGTPFYPIFGGGALPFRGNICLENSDHFLLEFRGVKTYTIQSGMRYDHGPVETRTLVEKVKAAIGHNEYLEFSAEDRDLIVQSIAIFAEHYIQELLEIVDKVLKVATLIPNQRERLLESTDISYYQTVRNLKSFLPFCKDPETRNRLSRLESEKLLNLPRVIRFTAALYTLGLPPEFIGTGNALKEIGDRLGQAWLDRLLDEITPSLRHDLAFASKFLSIESSENLVVTERISGGLKFLRETLDFEEPEASYSALSRTATNCIRDFWEGKNMMPQQFAIVLENGTVSEYLNPSIQENMGKLVLDMGKIRGSLG